MRSGCSMKYKRHFNFNPEIKSVIAKNIRKYRMAANITQEQLALDCDRSYEFIRRLETTEAKEGISLDLLYRISIVLDTRIDKFFEEDTSE